tara:strand:- start:26971 stop:27195 length:225 start_codon:yes stop_codon:yes gene_type:complete
LLLIDELRNDWTEMFTHIDEIVETITKDYPQFQGLIKQDIIQKAVLSTQKLDKIIEQAQIQSDKNQEQLFDVHE